MYSKHFLKNRKRFLLYGIFCLGIIFFYSMGDFSNSVLALAIENRNETGDTAVTAVQKRWLDAVQSERMRTKGLVPEEDAAGAVNGQRESNGFAFHTSGQECPWWAVDLTRSIKDLSKQDYNLFFIDPAFSGGNTASAPVYFNRIVMTAAHIPTRLNGYQIQTSLDGRNWTVIFSETEQETQARLDRGQSTIEHVFPEKTAARYLRIYVPRLEYMHLQEVEVYLNDSKNLVLNHYASQSSLSQWSIRSITLPHKANLPWQEDFVLADHIIMTILHRWESAEYNSKSESVFQEQILQFRKRFQILLESNIHLDNVQWAELYTDLLNEDRLLRDLDQQWSVLNLAALERTLDNLYETEPDRFADYEELKQKIRTFKEKYPDLYTRKTGSHGNGQVVRWEHSVPLRSLQDAKEIIEIQRSITLRLSLLDNLPILLLRRDLGSEARTALGGQLGVSTLNAHTNDDLRKYGWNNGLAILSGYQNKDASLTQCQTIYTPKDGKILTDPEMNFSGNKVMFSSIGDKEKNWRLFEFDLNFTKNGKGQDVFHAENIRQVVPDDGDDVGHFDSCYLPDDNIIFCSTASYQGLPCEYGNRYMVCLYKYDRATKKIRQLTYEQDSDWCPTVLPNGRVLYLRWEYSDLPHANSRILFHMNPDGTNQSEYYGSGSYFMPSFFNVRPIPGTAREVIGIASGHHGIPRAGRLLIVDPARGRAEADGVVQEIPGFNTKVEPVVMDRLVDWTYPLFLDPYPLNAQYHIVAMKPNPQALWGIWLVDTFDTMTLLYQEEGVAFIEPIAVCEQETPPILVDRTDQKNRNATVFLADIYNGPGLDKVERGTIKKLRIGGYYFSGRGVGGLLGSIGMDGPWDIKRVLGTVPVREDGSAFFQVPANTPFFMQPLDEKGQALQLMRSWTVGMPGENVACNGCHEGQNDVVPSRFVLSGREVPSKIEACKNIPSDLGLSFSHLIQPVLDRRCVGCHTGKEEDAVNILATLNLAPFNISLSKSPLEDDKGVEDKTKDSLRIVLPYSRPRPKNWIQGRGVLNEWPISLLGDRNITDWSSQIGGNVGRQGGIFSVSYANLHRYVRRPGIESDLHMLTPGEYTADTTELVQLLQDGKHYGVRLDAAEWDLLYTWIDMNAPFHGSWSSTSQRAATIVQPQTSRRKELAELYAGIAIDFEKLPQAPKGANADNWAQTFIKPKSISEVNSQKKGTNEQKAGQTDNVTHRMAIEIKLNERIKMTFKPIPNPKSQDHNASEINDVFWMGAFEISNEQFALYDSKHDSRLESRHGYQFGIKGYPMNEPGQPVVRVSCQEAIAFCDWIRKQYGEEIQKELEKQFPENKKKSIDFRITLPSRELWRFACRAGSSTPFSFGDFETDFSSFANLGDQHLVEYATCSTQGPFGHYTGSRILKNASKYDDWVLRDDRFDDGAFMTTSVGQYQPNKWGLYDMHGNAAEWTLPNNSDKHSKIAYACGGSFYDRPFRATVDSSIEYPAYRKVFNVGFRIALIANPKGE